MKIWPESSIEEILEENLPFKDWLVENNPDWESEYSGNIYGMLLAWKAGIESVADVG